jgi:Zn-finger nucleic acid-binding protein
MVLVERTRVGVAVDVCDRCRGVWLDRGELEKILAALREGERDRALLLAERHTRQEARKVHDRRKRELWSRMMELFE